MKGEKKRGRQKKRWEDNIKEWTGMDFATQLGQLKTGQDGKGLLRIHLWCPDDPLRLWDRIESNRTIDLNVRMQQKKYRIRNKMHTQKPSILTRTSI